MKSARTCGIRLGHVRLEPGKETLRTLRDRRVRGDRTVTPRLVMSEADPWPAAASGPRSENH